MALGELAIQTPKEIRDFDGETMGEAVVGQGAPKEQLEGKRLRHRMWLKRKQATAWRPAKRARLAAFHWGQAVDHQLQLSAGSSLQSFEQPRDIQDREAALQWPKLNVAMDLGSDGVAFLMWARYHRNLNIELVADSSHGVHNGVEEALASVGLRGHMYLLMMAINTPHGPWSEDTRFIQCKNSLGLMLQHDNPQESVMFNEFFQAILMDTGEVWRVGEEGLGALIWDELAEFPPFSKKGKKSTSRGSWGSTMRGGHSCAGGMPESWCSWTCASRWIGSG